MPLSNTELEGLFPGMIGCKLTHSVNQVIGSSIDTALTFDTELYDSGGMHSDANPTRIVFPVTGLYIVVANCTWAATGGGNQRSLFIRRDGSTMMGNVKGPQTPGGLACSQCLTVIDRFEATHYVETVVHQDGVPLNMLGQATVPYSPFFTVYLLVRET